MLETLEVVGLEGMHRSAHLGDLGWSAAARCDRESTLVNEPAVLLLDEPLGALDLKLRMQMQVELKSLQHRVGTTFIYVTHDQGEALVMSDRIAVMSHGRVEQIGSGRDIYLRPETAFVAAFIGETNFLDGEVRGVDGEVVIIATTDGDVKALATSDFSRGQRARVSLRPEALRVSPPADAEGCVRL